jgi:predicted PurR-regulated permease PerM
MLEQQLVKKRVLAISTDVFITLALVTLFVYLSIWIFSPFISVLLWAVILAVALHPAFLLLRRKFGGKTGWAATIIALLGLALLLGPSAIIVESVIDTLGPLATALKNEEFSVPPPNEAVKDWPLVGNWIYGVWTKASTNFKDTAVHFAPQLKGLATFLLSTTAGLAGGILQFALSIVAAAIILSNADSLSKACVRIANRVADERGRAMVKMVGATIYNVSRGVLGVAVIQGGLATIGIFAVGLPFAGVVSALTVASTIIQVPLLVIVPTIIYVWSAEPTLTATIFTIYMIPVLFSDNFLKPILMARGLETPMIVIFIGVIGGTIASGLLGLFIGPVVLAVFHKLVKEWVSSMDDAPAPENAPENAAANAAESGETVV